MLIALSGTATTAIPAAAPPQISGLIQASQQAPRVSLNQLVPIALKPKPALSTKAVQKKLAIKTSQCQLFKATVYGPPWGGIEGPGMTATGIKPLPGRHLIAVDPAVIPLGSKVTVQPNPHGWKGAFMAADTGGGINGKHIDIFMWQGPQAMDAWGVQQVQVCRI